MVHLKKKFLLNIHYFYFFFGAGGTIYGTYFSPARCVCIYRSRLMQNTKSLIRDRTQVLTGKLIQIYR